MTDRIEHAWLSPQARTWLDKIAEDHDAYAWMAAYVIAVDVCAGFPSIARIAAKTSLSKKQVRAALKHLEERGHLGGGDDD